MIARWICAALTAALPGRDGHRRRRSRRTRARRSETAIFAGGCFWCMEAAFDEVDGVTETISGYAGGTKPNPTYGDHEGYKEAVKVTYDPAKVTYANAARPLLAQYRSVRCRRASSATRAAPIRASSSSATTRRRRSPRRPSRRSPTRFKQKVATEIVPATTFTAAEDYHQDYHNQNPVSYKYYKWGCGRAQRLAADLGQAAFVIGAMRPDIAKRSCS